MAKSKKQTELEAQVESLTSDLKRIQADFENYRKRVELEKNTAREAGRSATIMKLLPTIDNIERAIGHAPERLMEDTWVKGIVGLTKQLETSLAALNVVRINASTGTTFDPDKHEAIGFDDAEGDTEVIAEELQAGYQIDGSVIRHSLVKVTKR